MRVLGPVVEPVVLTVLESQPHFPVGRRVAFELVGHHDPRCRTVFSQQLAHESLGGFGVGVASALYEYVQNIAILIYGPPYPVLLAFDRNDYLIEILLVAKGADTSADSLDRLFAKL